LTTLVAEGADDKTISAHMAADNKNKPVNAIWEQTLSYQHTFWLLKYLNRGIWYWIRRARRLELKP